MRNSAVGFTSPEKLPRATRYRSESQQHTREELQILCDLGDQTAWKRVCSPLRRRRRNLTTAIWSKDEPKKNLGALE